MLNYLFIDRNGVRNLTLIQFLKNKLIVLDKIFGKKNNLSPKKCIGNKLLNTSRSATTKRLQTYYFFLLNLITNLK